MGEGDDWPTIREKVLAADILVLATPIWLGHPASLAQRVLERLNPESSQTDDQNRPVLFDKGAQRRRLHNSCTRFDLLGR